MKGVFDLEIVDLTLIIMLYIAFSDFYLGKGFRGRRRQAFFREFRVVGQICREGMDESGILPKARYAMTVFHCLE